MHISTPPLELRKDGNELYLVFNTPDERGILRINSLALAHIGLNEANQKKLVEWRERTKQGLR